MIVGRRDPVDRGPKASVQDGQFIQVFGHEGLRFEAQQFVLAGLLNQQDIADWSQAIANRRQHFRPFEAERATGMDVDFNRAASHLADDFGERAGVFHVEITVWLGQGQIPLDGLRAGRQAKGHRGGRCRAGP